MPDFYNEDCITGAQKIEDDSVDLIICDPPFGISETSFDKHYKRENNAIEGYVEAPSDYQKFSNEWIAQAKRILKPNGTFYIVSGWTHLREILNSIDRLDLTTHNHIIWKYNFGVSTTKKFVSSHFHILRLSKGNNLTFNTHCRFGPQEKSSEGKSLLYADLEDVFVINKEYMPGKIKNQNKLPIELIDKLILYSSNENDLVCDFFLGNFTTAYSAIGLGRKATGFEINKEVFNIHSNNIQNNKKQLIKAKLNNLKTVTIDKPKNQGKPITTTELLAIKIKHDEHIKKHYTKKKSIEILMSEYGRGKFSIINILKKNH